MLAIALIVIGIALRFLPHTPNFTPVAAIAIFGGVYLNKKYSLIVPLALMMASDFFIGFHNVVLFTWGSFALIALLSSRLKKHKNILGIAGASIFSSLLFYLITNFGVWAMGWYPRTLEGLVNCYVMGLPFLRDFTVATFVYSFAFFGIYEFAAARIAGTKLSKALLT